MFTRYRPLTDGARLVADLTDPSHRRPDVHASVSDSETTAEFGEETVKNGYIFLGRNELCCGARGYLSTPRPCSSTCL
jgi:hypothetical protein